MLAVSRSPARRAVDRVRCPCSARTGIIKTEERGTEVRRWHRCPRCGWGGMSIERWSKPYGPVRQRTKTEPPEPIVAPKLPDRFLRAERKRG